MNASGFFDTAALEAVRGFYRRTPATPLRPLPGLAATLGLGSLAVKDETSRLGLPAFKILGARYAVARLLDMLDRPPAALAAASTGNHGRAVARAARQRGIDAHIYLPAGTLPSRIAALDAEGANVVVTGAGYDESVRLMARDAADHGWTVVSDASWDGYEDVPRWIMTGYTWMLQEARSQWDARPDILIVQAGVGSLAGAAAGWLDATYGRDRPHLVVAEPEGSACVTASLAAGARVSLDRCEPTAMAGLWCAEVSPLAWPVLHHVVDAAIGVTEEQDVEAMRMLVSPRGADPAIDAGPSGAAGLAALVRLARDPALAEMRAVLGVGRATRVMTIVTEGRTDRD